MGGLFRVSASIAQHNETAQWTITVRLVVYAAAVLGTLPSCWLSCQQEHKRLPWPRSELLHWGVHTHFKPPRCRTQPYCNDAIQPASPLLCPERMQCNESALW